MYNNVYSHIEFHLRRRHVGTFYVPGKIIIIEVDIYTD